MGKCKIFQILMVIIAMVGCIEVQSPQNKGGNAIESNMPVADSQDAKDNKTNADYFYTAPEIVDEEDGEDIPDESIIAETETEEIDQAPVIESDDGTIIIPDIAEEMNAEIDDIIIDNGQAIDGEVLPPPDVFIASDEDEFGEGEEVEVEADTTPPPQPCVEQPALCDDLNPCTDDFCDPIEGCGHIFNTLSCDDGNVCTEDDSCAEGICAGKIKNCDDNNVCTDDACQSGIGCVFSWICLCQLDTDCDDDNLCTDDQCANGDCQYLHNNLPCDDKDICAENDICQNGTCKGMPANCDDKDACTDDLCDSTVGCQSTLVDCDDSDACTKDACDKLKGCQNETVSCDDFNPCTDDSCDTEIGCAYANNTASCDDGNQCTDGDKCLAGMCIPGKMKNCTDSDPCTFDACDSKNGQCLYFPLSDTPCDDSNVCTNGDACQNGQCQGVAINCHDGQYCTVDSCEQGVGCIHQWICPCQFDAECEDNNPCTDDFCNPATGCANQPNTLPCSDNSVCTVDDVCANGKCLGVKITCDDSNPCTDDSCDVNKGCIFTPNAKPCSDGNACTDDICQNSKCISTPKFCVDDNYCTDDDCNPAIGCTHVNNSSPCDDGTVCTLTDFCQNGQCVGADPLDCDDGNPCSLDVCNKILGCQHSKLTGTQYACDDKDACTVSDYCSNGLCQPGQQICECYKTVNCMDDGNLCNGTSICNTVAFPHACEFDPGTVVTCNSTSNTTCLKNTCQPVSGKCEMKAVNEGSACDDGNPCTDSDICQNGSCAGSPNITGTIYQENFNDEAKGWSVYIHDYPSPNTTFCSLKDTSQFSSSPSSLHCWTTQSYSSWLEVKSPWIVIPQGSQPQLHWTYFKITDGIGINCSIRYYLEGNETPTVLFGLSKNTGWTAGSSPLPSATLQISINCGGGSSNNEILLSIFLDDIAVSCF